MLLGVLFINIIFFVEFPFLFVLFGIKLLLLIFFGVLSIDELILSYFQAI